MGDESNQETDQDRKRLEMERRWHDRESRELKLFLGVAVAAALLLGTMYQRANDDRNEKAIDLETARAEIELLSQTEMTPCGRNFSISEFEIGHPGGPDDKYMLRMTFTDIDGNPLGGCEFGPLGLNIPEPDLGPAYP